MKSITLLRHAKAVPFEDGIDDHDRALNARGRAAASAIGRQGGHALPDLVLCSSARRTRETWELIRPSWPVQPQVAFSDALYLADLPALLAGLAALPESVGAVWLIGHNPGLHELALYFLRTGGTAIADRTIETRFPTAARAVFTTEAPRWRDLAHMSCRLEDFILPARGPED